MTTLPITTAPSQFNNIDREGKKYETLRRWRSRISNGRPEGNVFVLKVSIVLVLVLGSLFLQDVVTATNVQSSGRTIRSDKVGGGDRVHRNNGDPALNGVPQNLRRIDRIDVDVEDVQVETASVTHKKGRSHPSDAGEDKEAAFWFVPAERCDWVLNHFRMRDSDYEEAIPSTTGTHQGGLSPHEERYQVQSASRRDFFRGTSHHFWMDFVQGEWAKKLLASIVAEDDDDDSKLEATLGALLESQGTWTWITGDQHLNNFGTYHNRRGDVVFGLNDFDEAAIYDFHVDVVRIAVSLVEQVVSSLSPPPSLSTSSVSGTESPVVHDIVREFCDMYIATVLSYVDNDDALFFEWTRHTATGKLKDFLKKVEKKNSRKKMIKKYTKPSTPKKLGKREFIKAPAGDEMPHKKTKLRAVDPRREEEIRSALQSNVYGATMMKLERGDPLPWNDDAMEVWDVAQRIGSGVGSYGVERYYVLLQGGDDSTDNDDEYDENDSYQQVILDVKHQPKASVEYILTVEESDWYHSLFANSAARTVEGQRHLTAFADPYTGWIPLRAFGGNSSTDFSNNDMNVSLPFSVRQRSPWKDNPDLDEDDWKDAADFSEYIRQIAVSIATSHVRATVAKDSKGFKHVLNDLLGDQEGIEGAEMDSTRIDGNGKTRARQRRNRWTETVVQLAVAYHKQVELDYGCFKEYVSVQSSADDENSEDGD